MYKVKRFSDAILATSSLGGATIGGVLGRKYRIHKARKDAESAYDPEEAEKMHLREADRLSNKYNNHIKEEGIDDEDIPPTIDHYRSIANDIRNNPKKYRRIAGDNAVKSLKNDIHNGKAERIDKYEKRGILIGGGIGSAVGLGASLKFKK